MYAHTHAFFKAFTISLSGLSMRHCETTADGELWFAIEHNKEYRKLQEQFYLAVQSYNPDNLQVGLSWLVWDHDLKFSL